MNRDQTGQLNKLIEEARLIHENGDTFRAIEFLESASIGSNSSRVLALSAHYRYLTQQYDSAQLMAQKAIELDPKCKLGLFTLGELAMKSRNLIDAATFFTETIVQGTKSPHPFLRLADIHNTNYQYDQSVNILTQGLEIHPGHEALLEKLQYALTMAGRIDEAGRIRKTRIRNQETETADIQTLLNRFDALPPEKAFSQLKILLSMKHYQKKTAIYDRLAALSIKLKKYDEAIDALEVVVTRHPRNDRVKLRLAEAFVRNNQPDEADAVLTPIELYRQDIAVRILRTEIFLAQGEHQKSMNLCVELLREQPRNKRLRALLVKIRKFGARPATDS